MRSRRRPPLAVVLLLGALMATISRSAHATPVDLLEADSQVFILDDGTADVIYTLHFRDNEGRREIRKIGQFYEPLYLNRASIRGDGLEGPVSARSLGDGYYRLALPDATRAGGVYDLVLHYRSGHRFADPTSRDGVDLLAVWFNPVRWGLPIGRSVIKLVLPLELPQTVERHEDISPSMVDALGVLTEAASLDEQDHWAFVFTDFEGRRLLTLYAERR